MSSSIEFHRRGRAHRISRRIGPVAAAIVLACLSGPARPDEPADDKARAAESLDRARKEVAALAIRPDSAKGEPLKPVAEPILKWSNPIAGTLYGDVFIWTSKGRPEVVGSFLEWYAPFKSREVELHSLSTGIFAAELRGQVLWSPTKPGVELKPIPDAPTPATSPAQRLRQLRDLAKEFTAQKRDSKEVDWDMRLLTQPIYRYEGTEGDLVDGALFVFVHATDPEVFLQVEARKVDGAVRWYYTLARFNSHSTLWVKHRGAEVWRVPSMPFSNVLNPESPYFVHIIQDPKG